MKFEQFSGKRPDFEITEREYIPELPEGAASGP